MNGYPLSFPFHAEETHKKRIGFTLVEMLVVLFILAALVGMLMPVFQRVKRNVEIKESITRLKQLHLVLSLYRQDYGGEGFARYDLPNAYYSLGYPLVVLVGPEEILVTT